MTITSKQVSIRTTRGREKISSPHLTSTTRPYIACNHNPSHRPRNIVCIASYLAIASPPLASHATSIARATLIDTL